MLRVKSTPRIIEVKTVRKYNKNKPLAKAAVQKFGTALYKTLVQMPGFERAWSRKPLSMTMDPLVSDSAYRLHGALSYLVWSSTDGSTSESLATLADISCQTKNTAHRALAELIKLGYVKREGKERKAGRLTLTSPALVAKEADILLTDSVESARAIKASHRLGQRVGKCSKCKAETSVRNSFKVCESCLDALRARRAEAVRKAS